MNAIPKKSSAAVLFAVYVCIEAFFVAGTVSGPVWREIFGLSNTLLGLCLGASGAGVLIASIFAGHATERKGPLRVLTFALCVTLLGLFTVAAASSFYMLFGGLLAVGICAAATHNAGITLLADIFPLRFRRVMSLASALWFGSSIITAPLIGGWLDYAASRSWDEWGFRVPFIVLAVMLAACLIAIRLRFRWLGPHSFRREDNVESGSPGRRSREWMWVLLLGFFHGMMLVSLLAWLNPMARDVLGVSQFLGSLLFGAMAFGLSSGRFLLALWHHRIWEDDRKVLALSGAAAALFFASALAATGYRMIFILVLVGGFACSATGPCLFSVVAARFPGMRSRLYGYMEASIAAAAIAGSFLVGLLYDAGVPLKAAMGLSPLAALLLGASALIWKKRKPYASR